MLGELTSHNEFKNSEFLTIIIDDGSTDGTGKWLTDYHPEVLVLKGDGNLWWSGCVNVGAKYALENLKVDFLLLWNNDIIPASDYFIEIDKLIEEMGDQTLAGAKIFHFGKDKIIWSFGGLFNTRNGKRRMIGHGQPDSEVFSTIISVDWLPGMGTLIPIQTIQKIGYWDEKTFPQYHGDSDFTFRAKRAGFKIMVYPQLMLSNDKSSSGLTHGDSAQGLRMTLTSIRSNYNIRKNILFYRRHATSFLAYSFLISDYTRLVGGFFKWKFLALIGIKRNR